MLIDSSSKPFEKPDSGQFIGVIADVIDLGPVPTAFGTKVKVRIVWVIDGLDYKNKPVRDSEGNVYRVQSTTNASMNEKSTLYTLVKSILGTSPSVPFNSEELIGKSNLLFIVREKSADGTKEFANVKAVLPLPAGTPALTVPANFVRSKDKPVGSAPQQTKTTVAAPAAQTGQAPVEEEIDVAF